ncbi:MAG: hypothetical protein EA400_05660 [Chromatiaceae bacterium]|nr:MAG: hypothetical protein EA400_05660 [Chromatiaceae bacterium]
MLARLVAVGMLVAALANGAGFFLKRIGVLEHAAYAAYLADYCDPDRTARWLGNRCSHWRPAPEAAGGYAMYERSHLYATPGAELLLKLAKDLFLALFTIGSLSLILLGRQGTAGSAVGDWFDGRGLHGGLAIPWPAVPLLASVAVGLAMAWARFGPDLAAAGLRSFWFLAVALVGGWLVSRASMSRLADAVGLLLLLQVPILALETWSGLPLDKGYAVTAHWNLPSRMSGSFIMPNSLGLAAALALAFYWAYSAQRRWWWPLVAVVVVLLLLSRSAGGFAVLGVSLASITVLKADRARRARLLLFSVAVALLLVWALPHMLMRGSLVESAFGRLDKLGWLLTQTDAWQQWLGQGLGVGTNSWLNLLTARVQADPTLAAGAAPPAAVALAADSTVTMLFAQIGWLGVAGFYGLMGWWLWVDRTGRVFALSLLLGSLVINLTELFPVNFLLGLGLSRALCRTGWRPFQPGGLRRPSAMRRT